MATKYLYLDDEDANSLLPLTSMASSGLRALSIDIRHPAEFTNDLSALFAALRKYNGLILDWRLDDRVNSKKQRFGVRAGALAQEIRTKITENKATAIPIVIWSQQKRLAKSFYGDITSHDLFDAVFKKEDVVQDGSKVGRQLIALASGYAAIAQAMKSARVANPDSLLKAESKFVDVRLREKLQRKLAVHDIARFIKRSLLDRPGALIDEDLLAARLGIDKASSRSWDKLLLLLKKYAYKGPFHDAWPRWWAGGVERDWWYKISGSTTPLSLLTAEERVRIIKRITRLRSIVPPNPLFNGYHSRFYTVCEHYRKPLDPVDGVLINEAEPEPWQDRRYLSIEAALKRLADDIEPHPIEKDRLRTLKVGQK